MNVGFLRLFDIDLRNSIVIAKTVLLHNHGRLHTDRETSACHQHDPSLIRLVDRLHFSFVAGTDGSLRFVAISLRSRFR